MIIWKLFRFDQHWLSLYREECKVLKIKIHMAKLKKYFVGGKTEKISG